MLTGEVAFTGPTAQATIARRFIYTTPGVCTVRPEVSASLALLVDRLLEKDSADRVATGAHVVSALRESTMLAALATTPRPDTTRSIVVLPFVNVSSDSDNAFVADGLTEELISDLSQLRALRVISRATAMQYKGSTRSVREIGTELGVRHALTGSVRKAGNALRISAQLVDVR